MTCERSGCDSVAVWAVVIEDEDVDNATPGATVWHTCLRHMAELAPAVAALT